MDPVSLVVGAAIALGGVMIGRLLPRRSPAPHPPPAVAAAPRTPQPICGCGHHLVFHDQESKLCQAQVVIPGRWVGQSGGTYRQCMCQGYRGPMPVDEYYAPDILGDS
ncbi:hypothetical protein ACFPZ0_18340 [Streptomonospora nanhaiensis]|uniref:hypothetical protein n=1 Tax=Streptomonospora nanhaiensis TaxID=1323731 RepID=UPI0015C7DF93|nr:hypothetical protein [Streptomonospora nanhaiensis]MBV2366278.1 hypothetical protein [Streptomonospora nanhaiensis]MBX9390359.1 hypothetical protein [Streptomonospora nanhaiensis]